jgi:hypothetical protein
MTTRSVVLPLENTFSLSSAVSWLVELIKIPNVTDQPRFVTIVPLETALPHITLPKLHDRPDRKDSTRKHQEGKTSEPLDRLRTVLFRCGREVLGNRVS